MNTSTAQCTCNPGYHLLGNGACAGMYPRSNISQVLVLFLSQVPSYFMQYVICSVDINECLTSGVCSHLCTNTKGSYYCSCPGGLFLSSDRRTCSGTYMGMRPVTQEVVKITPSICPPFPYILPLSPSLFPPPPPPPPHRVLP